MTITLESIAKHGIDDTLTTEEIAYLLATQEELERLRRLERAVATIGPSNEEREKVLRDEGEAMPSLSWYIREAGLGSWGSEYVSDWIYGIADTLGVMTFVLFFALVVLGLMLVSCDMRTVTL